MNSVKNFGFLLGLSALAFGVAPAIAQEAEREVSETAQEVVVLGEIAYRDRAQATAPILSYGLDYFQRFEPLTAGDALKRVPSVAFLSDVTESDGVRLRGLDPAYTQILINGEKVPGAGAGSGTFGNGADGAFFVDRIPAELIERVEVVRSASANRSGDALAGAINIVLRDAYSLDGGYVRAGLLYFSNDGHWGETLGGVYGGQVGPGRLLIGANLQDRHNPKDKFSARFDAPGAPINDIEDQTDVRDGTDYSANFSYEMPVGPGELKLDGFYVHTDRQENEDSIEYVDGVRAGENTLTLNDNNVDIEQDSWSLDGAYKFGLLGGKTRVKFGYARFENTEFEIEDESEFLRDAVVFPEVDRFTGEVITLDLTDDEFKAKLEHERQFGAVTVEAGVHYEQKERDNLVRAADGDFGTRVRVNLPAGTTSTTARPAGIVGPSSADAAPVAGGDNTITRTRIDPYLMASGKAGALAWETGLRWETTETEVEDRSVALVTDNSYGILLPSAHVKFDATENDRFSASVARTVRNPSFEFLSPALLIGALEDSDFRGDPSLEPEKAWGVDLGYERRLGRAGVFGVNVFYRSVEDLIEVFNTGEGSAAAVEEFEDENGVSPGDPGAPPFEPTSFVYSARNTGDGAVYGVEFDLSTPLSFIGLENTGVFFNYSYLDSEVDDEFGSRRFNDQAEFVFNVGFIHDIPALGAAFGATYRKQGDAFSRVVSEEITTEYGADLEAFVEKRIGERFTVRLTGSNLLDASKDETFNKFANEQDQRDRAFDEFELESETSGPYFQLIGRYAF